MIYTSFSLNGAWLMNYSEEKYLSCDMPRFREYLIENAVPGYWEDMTDSFAKKGFYRDLRINTVYGIWEYPISDYCPDMSLPNILGNFFYKRTFLCENVKKDAVLHFGGVQNAVSVWINGEFLGRHEGYSTQFDIKIPDGLLHDGENTVVLSVSNHCLEGFDSQHVVGLSSRAVSECSGGIWGDVELRVYNCPLRDVALTVSEDLKTAYAHVEAMEPAEYEWEVLDGSRIIKRGSGTGDISFATDGLEYWSPENPKIYVLCLICGEGTLERTFGVRRLTVDGVHFKLNDIPYYLRGACEHCYYPETVNPPRDLAFYRGVIKKLKSLGFNYIRFHTHVPTEEYMLAADELGMLMQIESPSNTTFEEWCEIVKTCRRHTSTVIYCCGNELQLYDGFIAHLGKCAEVVHKNTDSLFSPMSALRGLEYAFNNEPELLSEVVEQPLKHNPRRFNAVSEFSDLYNSYTLGHHSYSSMNCNVDAVDSWNEVYNKPRLSHEICIDGTYTDLSLKERYKGTRIGKYSGMHESIEKHLEDKGLLQRAPLYFKNSCEWQRRVRKYCFEAVRRGENIAGYDFLGPIDTHWHTFGYDVGMMNEFYELKPSESVRNVLTYNSDTVLLTSLGRKSNFASGETLCCDILASCFGVKELKDANLNVILTLNGKPIHRMKVNSNSIDGGKITKLCDVSVLLPKVEKPSEMKLSVTLDAENGCFENSWELYLYPRIDEIDIDGILFTNGISEEMLVFEMESGRDVVILGASPFQTKPLSFRIALAGRTTGNLATVIADHPIFEGLPHEGFCSWQFESLMDGGNAIVLEGDGVPYEPIVEVASSHKNAIKQAAMFEFNMLNGRFLVCSFNFRDDDPAARWLKREIVNYARSERFAPKHTVSREGIRSLVRYSSFASAENGNFAFNPNDKATAGKK